MKKPSQRTVVLAAVCVLLYLMFWRYDCTPWAAHRARQNIGLVHRGMTDAQVWETLGLTSYHFPAHVSGSGNPRGYPANYLLWPGDTLFCRWNLTTNPPVLVEAYFKVAP
jgi:hypothetical protein